MITQVHPTELSSWLQAARAHGVPLLLDVREAAELRAARVQPTGFDLLHIPLSVFTTRLGELDPNRPTAVLCHHGVRSMQVAAFLGARGFTRLANIAGGIDAWSDQLDAGIPKY